MISPRISSPWSFLSDWIFPIIVAQYIHEEGPHCIAEDLNRRKRPVCNGSFDDESIVVVDKDLEALDLMPIDFARPAQKRRPIIQPVLSDIFPFTDIRRNGKDRRRL